MNKFTKNFLAISTFFLLVFTFAGIANAQNFGIINSNGYGSGSSYGSGYTGSGYNTVGYNPISYNNYGNSGNYGSFGLGFNSMFANSNNYSSFNTGLGFNYGSGYGSGYGNEVIYSPIYNGYNVYQPNYYGGYGILSPVYQPYNSYYGSSAGYGYGTATTNNSYQNFNTGYTGGFYW